MDTTETKIHEEKNGNKNGGNTRRKLFWSGLLSRFTVGGKMEMQSKVQQSLILESQWKIHNRNMGNTRHPTSRPDKELRNSQELIYT